MDRKRLFHLLAGPSLLLIMWLLVPESAIVYAQRIALGTVLWMSYWWVTGPVENPVVAFVPLAVNALFGAVPMASVLGNYMNSIVMLVLAANVTSITWTKTGLDKRVALRFLCLIGTSAAAQLAVWLAVSAVLSSFLPNIATCALLLPIASAMIRESTGEGQVGDGPGSLKLPVLILCTIVWGAGIGGMGTPLGGAMNLVAVEWFETVTGHSFSFLDWVTHIYPIMLVYLVCMVILLVAVCPRNEKLEGTREYLTARYRELGRMRPDEWKALILFGLPGILCFFQSLWAKVLPGLTNTYLFVLFALLSFCITGEDKKPINTWKETARQLPWGMLLGLGGGLAMGSMMTGSGVSDLIADLLGRMGLTGGFVTVLAFSAACMLIAEFSSNSVAASIIYPVVVSVCAMHNLPTVAFMYMLIPAFNTAYMMPTAIRSMPMAYGVKPVQMMRYGAVLTGVSLLLIPALCYLFYCLTGGWFLQA